MMEMTTKFSILFLCQLIVTPFFLFFFPIEFHIFNSIVNLNMNSLEFEFELNLNFHYLIF